MSLALKPDNELVDPYRPLYGSSNENREYSPVVRSARSPNRTATTLASSMIRTSLHDIRRKLDNMKKNKEEIGQDLIRYEQQQHP